MYDEMMTALLRIVLAPIRPALRQEGDNSKRFDLWHHVRSPAVSDCEPKKEPATCWANLLNWKAFTRKNRQMILAEFA